MPSSANVTTYYQTFTGLASLNHECSFNHFIVAALHFGYNDNGSPYMHLNDINASDAKYEPMWKQLRALQKINPDFKVSVMVGGAAGQDFKNLFADFHVFYPLLQQFLAHHYFISGVDIDVEEQVQTNDVQMLVRQLRRDFGTSNVSGFSSRFTITMAPVCEALMHGESDPYGLDYKQLDSLIDFYHVQCYGEFKPNLSYVPRSMIKRKGGIAFKCDGDIHPGDAYRSISSDIVQSIIANGFPASKLVLGMLGNSKPDPEFCKTTVPVLQSIRDKFQVKGFYVWEYFMAPPQPSDPNQWAKIVAKIVAQPIKTLNNSSGSSLANNTSCVIC